MPAGARGSRAILVGVSLRTAVLGCTLLAAGLAPAACSRATQRAPARRVILVTCDTLRADRLGCYGCALPTSPEVDAFARDALVFDEAWSAAPWTGPALAALMTGRMPDELGVAGGNRFPLPAAALTLAEIARAAGLPTGAVVSNWILRRPPASFGDAGLAQGFAHFDDEMRQRELNREAFERTAPGTTDAALAWLEERRRAGEERFLAWFHFQDPHGPYAPPPALRQRFQRAAPPDEAPLAAGTTVKGKGQIPSYQVFGDERLPEQYRARYDGEVACFDEQFGRLVAWLKRAGWYEDALIVLTADHGESLGEEDYWFCHGENVRPEVVHVPLLVHFPAGCAHVRGEMSAGTIRVATPVSHLDLWPTVLEALRLEGAQNRGRSLFAENLPASRLLVQTMGRPGAANRWVAYGDERWRVVIEGAGAPRLYDRAQDPRQLHDVAAGQAQLLNELALRHEQFLAAGSGPLLEGRALEKGGESERGLHALGYTDSEH